jgi:hypothetical protein
MALAILLKTPKSPFPLAKPAKILMGRASKPRRKTRPMTDIVPIRRALLSVSDKTGLVDLGKSWRKRVWSWFRPAARPRLCAMRVWT